LVAIAFFFYFLFSEYSFSSVTFHSQNCTEHTSSLPSV
jgi:hypothetical protein